MEISWIYALIGGMFIGLSASVLLMVNGRITGVSGIFFGAIKPSFVPGDWLWRVKFVIGLILGGFIGLVLMEDPFVNHSDRSFLSVVIAGLLVGFGTKLGSGCTSGHGVCGISRLSIRSLAATAVFILSGIVTVYLLKL